MDDNYYEVWTMSDELISSHEKIAYDLSYTEAINFCTKQQHDMDIEYIYLKLQGNNISPIKCYIRQSNEPTYLIWIKINEDINLDAIIFNKTEAEQYVKKQRELFNTFMSKYQQSDTKYRPYISIDYKIEMRDDSSDREENDFQHLVNFLHELIDGV